MPILKTLNLIYDELNEPGAIVRVDVDEENHGGRHRVAVIARGKYVSVLVEDEEWEDPNAPAAIGAALLKGLDAAIAQSK